MFPTYACDVDDLVNDGWYQINGVFITPKC